jgi:Tfp pilus assembly protein PilW
MRKSRQTGAALLELFVAGFIVLAVVTSARTA